MEKQPIRLLAGNAHPALALAVAEEIGVPLVASVVTSFADGEPRVVIDESVRGQHVFVLQPTGNPVPQNYLELFAMLDALKRARVDALTVVMPYMGCSRQDRKKGREPITASLMANLLETAAGPRLDAVVAVDLHAEQIQGFFKDVHVADLHTTPLFARNLKERVEARSLDIAIVSPDVSGAARARTLADAMGGYSVIIGAKRRSGPNEVAEIQIIGDARGKTCVVIDDMIDTGGSLLKLTDGLFAAGAAEVMAACSHPLLSGPAKASLDASRITEIVALDTVPVPPERRPERFHQISCAPLLAEAIRRMASNESVSDLNEPH